MYKLKQVLSLLLRSYFTICKSGFPKLNRVNADYIIWAPNYYSLGFWFGDNLQKSFATYFYLKKQNKSVTIYTSDDIGRFYGKKIIYFGSQRYNKFSFSNYVSSMQLITSQLEDQGNDVFPNTKEVKLWENKAEMHQIFERMGIRCPESKIIELDNVEKIDVDTLKFPLLFKEEHSCSSNGVHKIENSQQAWDFLSGEAVRLNNKKVVAQQLLNMRRDLRVIIVDDEIVLHYFRINNSKEWKTTSTGEGSSVDFNTFPETWRHWILAEFSKLDIRTGAFDIAWEDDDLSTEPYILEVSPFYQPNPVPVEVEQLISYGRWKKSIRFKNGYQQALVNIIFEIQEKFVKQL